MKYDCYFNIPLEKGKKKEKGSLFPEFLAAIRTDTRIERDVAATFRTSSVPLIFFVLALFIIERGFRWPNDNPDDETNNRYEDIDDEP